VADNTRPKDSIIPVNMPARYCQPGVKSSLQTEKTDFLLENQRKSYICHPKNT
jgi:hypothetical protein